MYAALPVSAERRTLAARARVRGEQKVRRGCEGSSIPYDAAFCRLRKGSDKLKAAVPDFCFPIPTFGNISHKYKRPPPEGPRRRFAPQSGLARPSSAGAAAFSAFPMEALNKSRHASCLHIFRLIARKLLEIHQVFLRHFHTITVGGFRYEKSVCAICIPDLISASIYSNSPSNAAAGGSLRSPPHPIRTSPP